MIRKKMGKMIGTACVMLFCAAATVANVHAESNICYEAKEPECVIVDDYEDIENEELFEGYVQQAFLGNAGISMFSVNRVGNRLSGNDKIVYDYLKTEIEKIAAGERDNARIQVPSTIFVNKTTFTAKDLGVVSLDDDEAEGIQALYDMVRFDSSKVLYALLADCAYEQYWFEKTKGWKINSRYEWHWSDGEYSLGFENNIAWNIDMYVDASFSQTGEVGTFDVDTTKTSATITAANNAKEIVEEAKYKSDYEKLEYYANTICDLVEYDHEAAKKHPSGMGTISPWQLIYVFDKNEKTNVVCEGYAKAFQYLCEMTHFNHEELYCMQMTGYMDGGGHMWNTVHMWDGKNYLVDVTNYENYHQYNAKSLFMDAGSEPTSGDIDFRDEHGNTITKTFDGYNVKIPRIHINATSYIDAHTIQYLYDAEMYDMYDAEELSLSTSAYVAPAKGQAPNAPVSISGCMGKPLNEAMLSAYPGWEWVSTKTIPNVLGDTITAQVVYNGSDKGEYLTENQDVTITAAAHDFGTGKQDVCSRCDVKNINGTSLDSLVTVERLTYNGKPQTIDGYVHGLDSSKYEVNCVEQTEVGNYYAFLLGRGDYSGNRLVSWEIEKGTLLPDFFTAVVPGDLEYTGTEKAVSVITKSSIRIDGEQISISGVGEITTMYGEESAPVSELTTQAPTDVGTYDIYAKVEEGTNYKSGLVKVGSFSITRASASISASKTDYTKRYGDESFTLTGITKVGDGTLTYASSDEDVVKVSSDGLVTVVGVGTADVYVDMAQTANYQQAPRQTIHINVDKKQLDTPESFEKEYYYGRAASDTVDISGFMPEDAGAITYSVKECVGDFATAPSVSAKGSVAYGIASGAINDVLKVVVGVTSANYEDVEITIVCTRIAKKPIALKEGEEISLVSNKLTYGDKLSELTFNPVVFVDGNDEIDGTLRFVDASVTPQVADKTADWIFEPTDAAYKLQTGSVAIDVKKAIPAYTVPRNLTATCMQTLEDVELPARFAFADTRATLESGTIYYVVFTPEDMDNYSIVENIPVQVAIRHGDEIMDAAVDPTCEEAGKTAGSHCLTCGKVIKAQETVEALGHTWDAGAITTEPTETAEGVKTYTCMSCDKTKTEIIPKKEATKLKTTREVAYSAPVEAKKEVTIPTTVVVNGETYQVTKIEEGAFQNNKIVTKITVGANIKTIEKDAFSGATALKAVTIGKNVEEIGTNAFKGCKKLKTLKITSKKLTSKTVAKNAFKGITKSTTIKVPKSKLKAYKKLFKQKGLSAKVKIKTL